MERGKHGQKEDRWTDSHVEKQIQQNAHWNISAVGVHYKILPLCLYVENFSHGHGGEAEGKERATGRKLEAGEPEEREDQVRLP